jgi:hypothetical protein
MFHVHVLYLWYPSHDEECFLLAEVYSLLVEAHSLLVDANPIPIPIQASAVPLYYAMESHLSVSLHRCQDKRRNT